MRLRPDHVLKFDRFLPIFNWFYPLNNLSISPSDWDNVVNSISSSHIKHRALYLHMPFCRSICTFCPFTRSINKNDEIVDAYVNALVREIELKAQNNSRFTSVPINAIFFGGGSPSILGPKHLLKIGLALRNVFNLSGLQEFSLEMSLADISMEKLYAMREIGVTHARFGVQTFNEDFRHHFGLITSLDSIYENATLLQNFFPIVSFDMLYGMDGQTESEFISDLEKAVVLGIKNIAFYPINNLVTNQSLHKSLKESGRRPLSGSTRFYMNVLLREFMESVGFLPHNGHEYVAVGKNEILASPVTTRTYSFLYHKNLYGYSNSDILGFGVDATSVTRGYVLQNTSSISTYIDSVTRGRLPYSYIGQHSEMAYKSRGVILHLPYHSYLDQGEIELASVHPETMNSLKEVTNAGLIEETSNGYKLTKEGWYWYVNLMYYLSPHEEQAKIDRFIFEQSRDRNSTLDHGYIDF